MGSNEPLRNECEVIYAKSHIFNCVEKPEKFRCLKNSGLDLVSYDHKE